LELNKKATEKLFEMAKWCDDFIKTLDYTKEILKQEI